LICYIYAETNGETHKMSNVFNSQVEDLNEIFREIEKKKDGPTKLIDEATEIVYIFYSFISIFP